MTNLPDGTVAGSQPLAHGPSAHPEKRALSPITLWHQFSQLKWLIPAALLLLVVVYEAGPSRWIALGLGEPYHLFTQILVYGTVGPLLAFKLLDFLSRWLEERETTDLQAQVLARAREQAQLNQRLHDDALQALFAASALIAALESNPALSPEALAQLREARCALQQTIQKLHTHLLSQ